MEWLNDERKMFLIGWLPIMIIIIGCLLATIGREIYDISLNKIEMVTLNDVLPSICLVLMFSLFMFIISGFESVDNFKKVKKG